MNARIDITNQRFGRLIVIRPSEPSKHRQAQWLCQCDCGNQRIALGTLLRTGRTTSCGCDYKRFRHGHAHTKGKQHPVYDAWKMIHQRCYNPKNPSFKNYGGRGIKVHTPWKNFKNFLADVGERPHPDLTLDRIDNDHGYFPGNVQWATKKEQTTNRHRFKYGLNAGILSFSS